VPIPLGTKRVDVVAWQAILTVPIFVWLYGWQPIDRVEWRTMIAAPFTVALEPAQQFLYGSPFTHLAGAYYVRQGLDADQAFWIVHGLGLILLAFALFRFLVERCGADRWASGALVLAGSPMLLTIVSWIGKDDTYLLAFYLLMLRSSSEFTRMLLCASMVICHRELSLAMLAAHALIRGDAIAVAIGAAAGLTLSFTYTNALLNQPPLTRVDYLLQHLSGLITASLAHPVARLAATLGPFWLYVLRPSALTARRLVVLAGAGVLAGMTVDFTRVFVLAASPLIFSVTEDLVAELRERDGIALFGWRVPVAVLGLLAFAQVQIAGNRLSWIQGFSWSIGS
jgi:hypothetical protein